MPTAGATVTTITDPVSSATLTWDTASSQPATYRTDGPGGTGYVDSNGGAVLHSSPITLGTQATIIAIARKPTPVGSPNTAASMPAGDHASLLSTPSFDLYIGYTDLTRTQATMPWANNAIDGSGSALERMWINGAEVGIGSQDITTDWAIVTIQIRGLPAGTSVMAVNKTHDGYGVRDVQVRHIEVFAGQLLTLPQLNYRHSQLGTKHQIPVHDATAVPATKARMHAPIALMNRRRILDGSDVDSYRDWAARAIRQLKYTTTANAQGVTGYYANPAQLSINKGSYSIPLYVVPQATPRVRIGFVGYSAQRTQNADSAVSGLGARMASVPLPPLATIQSGTNQQFVLGAAAAAGATTLQVLKGPKASATDTGCVPYLFPAGVQYVIEPGTANSEVFTSTESFDTEKLNAPTDTTQPYPWLITALTNAHPAGALFQRAHQIEADGNDKHCGILCPTGNVAGDGVQIVEFFELWGLRPSLVSPSGWAFAFGGYCDDFYHWNGVFKYTWGSRACGLSMLSGLVTVAEWQAAADAATAASGDVTKYRDAIPHAIGVGYVVTGSDYGAGISQGTRLTNIAPANRWDGTNYSGVKAGAATAISQDRMVMGSRWAISHTVTDAQILAWVNSAAVVDQPYRVAVGFALRDYGAVTIDTTTGAAAIYVEDERASKAGFGFGAATSSIPSEWRIRDAVLSAIQTFAVESLLPVMA